MILVECGVDQQLLVLCFLLHLSLGASLVSRVIAALSSSQLRLVHIVWFVFSTYYWGATHGSVN